MSLCSSLALPMSRANIIFVNWVSLLRKRTVNVKFWYGWNIESGPPISLSYFFWVFNRYNRRGKYEFKCWSSFPWERLLKKEMLCSKKCLITYPWLVSVNSLLLQSRKDSKTVKKSTVGCTLIRPLEDIVLIRMKSIEYISKEFQKILEST